MSTVYILGAGASFDAGAPLMKKFFDKAEDLCAAGYFENSQEISELLDTVRNLNSLYAKTALDLFNIEVILGLLEMAQVLNYELPNSKIPADKLKEVYIKMLAQTIEGSMDYVNSNNRILPKGSYNEFAEYLSGKENYSIINFNYDLGLEFALNFNRVKFNYCLDNTRGQIPYLKLHGSLNWYQTSEGIKVVPTENINAKRDLFDEAATIRMSNHARFEIGEPVTAPFIVPPTWNKMTYHSEIKNVWQNALTKLNTAVNIVIIGYSLPETDSFFHYLYALGTSGTTRIRRIEIVNPDPEVEKRFREMISPALRDNIYFSKQTFSEWLKSVHQSKPSYNIR